MVPFDVHPMKTPDVGPKRVDRLLRVALAEDTSITARGHVGRI
jgi:hypothetical protein